MATKFHCSMQKKESPAKSNESVSTTDARKFVDAHSNGILSTLAEMCALTADTAIEYTNEVSGPNRLEAVKDSGYLIYEDYEETLKDLVSRLINKFVIAKVEGWNSTTLMNANL